MKEKRWKDQAHENELDLGFLKGVVIALAIMIIISLLRSWFYA
jgi:tetrahydromethanopterin S-methyltransferase subunit G